MANLVIIPMRYETNLKMKGLRINMNQALIRSDLGSICIDHSYIRTDNDGDIEINELIDILRDIDYEIEIDRITIKGKNTFKYTGEYILQRIKENK